jgi:hypothetical protein
MDHRKLTDNRVQFYTLVYICIGIIALISNV